MLRLNYILFIFCLLTSKVWAGSLFYVSNQAINNYSIGNDSNGCTNKTTDVCLTISRASIPATNGDTIIINCGLYTEAITNNETLTYTPDTACVPPIFDKTSLTWNLTDATSGGVIIRPASGTTVITHAVGITIGALLIDSINATTTAIQPSAVTNSMILNGTGIKDWGTGSAINDGSGRDTTFSMTNVIMASTRSGSGSAVTHYPSTAQSDIYNGVTITATALGAGTYGIDSRPSVSGATANITNLNISLQPAAGSTTLHCGRFKGINTNFIGVHTCLITNSTNSYGWRLDTTAAQAMYISCPVSAAIYASLIAPTAVAAGAGFEIGDDAQTAAGTATFNITCPIVINGFNHGIMLGAGTSGNQSGGFVNEASIGILIKGTNNGAPRISTGNIVTPGPLSLGALYFKGAQATDVIAHSSVLLDSRAALGSGMSICMSSDNTTTAGAAFKNNICSAPSIAATRLVQINANSNGTVLINNDYDATTTATTWQFNGSNYANLAAWQVIETSALGLAPSWVGGTSPTTVSGFILSPNSPLISAGICLNPRHKDFYSRRFDCPTTIGAIRGNGSEQKVDATAAP